MLPFFMPAHYALRSVPFPSATAGFILWASKIIAGNGQLKIASAIAPHIDSTLILFEQNAMHLEVFIEQ